MNSTKKIRVSYLITTRNRCEYLAKTLDNVREFITPEDELIIIDGESTDGTRELVEKNRDIVSNFVSEPDRGESHAFNKGVFRARGKYIKPITDDDYFYPKAIHKLVATMDENPDIDVLIAGGEHYRVIDGEEVCECVFQLPKSVSISTQEGFWKVSCGLGLIVRREVFEVIGGVSNNYISVDGDLICKVIESGITYKYLDICLYRWFLHAHSGFNKNKQIERDYDMFSIRFNNCSSQIILESFIKKTSRGECWDYTKFSRGENYAIKTLLLQFREKQTALGYFLSFCLVALNKFAECWISSRKLKKHVVHDSSEEKKASIPIISRVPIWSEKLF